MLTNQPLYCLYRDEALLVVHKPAGLLVHPSAIDRHETEFALHYARELAGQKVFPVHRLDKPTSGLLVFALSSQVASTLGQAMMAREVEKQYLAVVRGWPAAAGRIDHPLKRDPVNKQDRREQPIQSAVSDYQRLAQVELPIQVDRYPSTRYALVQIQPHEGRKHQLRRHLKHLGHPILGDVKQGKGPHNRYMEHTFGRGLWLACVQMRFAHPLTGAPLCLDAPLEARFTPLLQAWGWWDDVPSAWQPRGERLLLGK
ncbi:pseudouridine synthase [Marinospirillum sp.]|uniref:pseudouridine synthase n=1 Tax=Marinospirillum sp. TaxID=2183934 RepID=UPI003A8505CD